MDREILLEHCPCNSVRTLPVKCIFRLAEDTTRPGGEREAWAPLPYNIHSAVFTLAYMSPTASSSTEKVTM